MTDRTSQIDLDRLRDRLVALVRMPSITGQEDAAINKLATWLQDCGAEVDYWNDGLAAVQRDPRYPGHEVERAWVPVVAGSVRGERPGPTVLLTGHVDVVPPGDYDQWATDPFSGHVEGDTLHGCGASDMKSGLVAALEAFETFATHPRKFAGRVVFIAVPAEEDSGLGTLAAIRRGWEADAAIIPEPTTTDGVTSLVVAHAGAMSFTLEIPGRSAHASKRHLGESALEHFLPIHKALRENEFEINEAENDPLMRKHTLPYSINFGTINGGLWSSSVIDSVKLQVRVGVSLSETIKQAEKRFRAAVTQGASEVPWLVENPPIVTRLASGFGSSSTPVEHPLVKAVQSASEQEFGESAPLTAAPYGCDMSGWVRLAGVPTVVYGPGDLKYAHAPNEQVSLKRTEEVCRVLIRATEQLLECDSEELAKARPPIDVD